KAGALCRYPIQDTVSYGCDETREDRRLADEIRNLSTQLLGLGNLREPLRLPKYLADDGVSEQQYLKMRLGSAKGLAAYNVMSRLRSSRAALFEHLRGNEAAKEKFGLGQYNKSDTGNLARIIEKLRHRPPKFYLDVTCPEFLETPANFATACDVELDVYRRIEGCVLEMSASRESAKVELLRSLRKDHERILAFDTCLITLYDLCQRMGEVEGTRVLVATGENKRQRDEVQRHFGLESQTRAIALCSDSLAEGVNLQGASAVVLLDTPSVIRRAEQRIGRIDRMDSPYRQISVYWPNDAEAFAVRSDELFLERYGDVADLLGTNFELPANLEAVRNQHRPITGTELGELITTFETADLNDIRDAFFPVRQLVEGDQALVPADVYESVRTSKARILTAVSVVKSDSTWGFYALAGGSQAVPRWVFVQGISTPLTDLGVVAKKLRERLGKTTTRLPLDERATAVIARDVSLLQQSEENLLPRRKRRALSLLRNMVSTYIRSAGDPRRQRVLRRVRNLIEPVPTLLSFDKLFTEHQKDEVVNLEVIADWWLERVRPAWHQHLLARRRRRAARMTELRKHLVGEPLETEVFESLLAIGDRLWRPALADRIVAVIVGVPDQ
ncbi:MAG TPA: C-terminal helicase domain-containing protein, partial [Longimicrobiaceae bacterium]|nr:C-terminal helicase domain-containing protein [Longimicrobiaceae bacterium]